MRRVGVSPVRSEAQHRSDSVARSTPTLWAKAHKGTPKNYSFIRILFKWDTQHFP
ncbi:MAG: hypothetical protein NZ519_08755 [Bacteroidia bacterium]|nr:hypothetical protein [Bacteroidia bacterium]